MDPDQKVCYCFHITRRKLVNFTRRTVPKVPSQLSECGGAGTGCGWCIPFLKQIFHQVRCGGTIDLDQMTDEEYARYQERASRAGLAVGAFARAAGLEGAGPRARRRRPIEHAALAQLMAAMNRVGNNLNQLARGMNIGEVPEVPELRDAARALLQARDAIFEALGKEPAGDHQGKEPGWP